MRELHGLVARVTMALVGLLLACSFGALGLFIVREIVAATSSILDSLGLLLFAALVLTPALYGAWLAWRGIRGYSRPAGDQRIMVAILAVIFLCGLAGFGNAVLTVFRLGPALVQHAPWYTQQGGAWQFVMMTMAVPFQLAAHELGHIAAGRWVGFEFLSVQVGPFCLDRPSHHWRVTWQPLTFGLGGRATMAFHGKLGFPRCSAIYAAGGPAANLLFALAAGLVVAALPAPESSAAAVAVGLLEGCAIEGAILGLYNLLPVRGAGTDGARIVTALQTPRELTVVPRNSAAGSVRARPLRLLDRE
jgi:hypothetical protein